MKLGDIKKFFEMENRTRHFARLLASLFAASVIIFVLLLVGNSSLDEKEAGTVKNKADAFEGLSLEGKGIAVLDVVNNREIFSQNADLPLPLASLTKVMTAVTLDGKVGESERVEITMEDIMPEGDSKLLVGDSWKAKDLRDFTLLTSSNDGAFALAAVAKSGGSGSDGSFVDEMNRTAAGIGLSNSKFFNEHGLDDATHAGAYGSARDMAALFAYAIKNHPEVLEATRYKNLEFASANHKYSAENTNEIVDKIPNLIASKTGYTDLAGGNLVVAFDAGLGRPIIISVLGSSSEGRFSDVLQLVSASLKYIQEN